MASICCCSTCLNSRYHAGMIDPDVEEVIAANREVEWKELMKKHNGNAFAASMNRGLRRIIEEK